MIFKKEKEEVIKHLGYTMEIPKREDSLNSLDKYGSNRVKLGDIVYKVEGMEIIPFEIWCIEIRQNSVTVSDEDYKDHRGTLGVDVFASEGKAAEILEKAKKGGILK